MAGLGRLTIKVTQRRCRDAHLPLRITQGVGYLMAIPGPILVGLLHDRTDGWRIPLALMIVLMVPQIIASYQAGRDRQV